MTGPGPTGFGRTARVVGASAFILATVQYAIAQLVAASAWSPRYSWTKNFISDLGNTACGPFAVPHGKLNYVCSPDHALMNGSFVLAGILTLVGTAALWRLWPARRMTTIALVLLVCAGVLKLVVGLAPENVNVSLHVLGALNLPLESVAILLLSLSIVDVSRALWVFGLVVAAAGLVGSVLTSAAQYAGNGANLGLGNGGMERVAAYPGNVWLVVVGVVVIATGRGFGLVGNAGDGPANLDHIESGWETAVRAPRSPATTGPHLVNRLR